MEIDSMADIPAGTGLGSSSSYLVGLLTAIRSHLRIPISPYGIAEEACHIELDVLSKKIGKQDQFMAAFGGLTILDIDTTGAVKVRHVQMRMSSISTLINHTHLYYTGILRNAMEVLKPQNDAMNSTGPDRNRVQNSLMAIKELGYRSLALIVDEEFDEWGLSLHEHWTMKLHRLQSIIYMMRLEVDLEFLVERSLELAVVDF
jgi:D-glycero-alpha-D-manno-heptose-7-phosphate kinase